MVFNLPRCNVLAHDTVVFPSRTRQRQQQLMTSAKTTRYSRLCMCLGDHDSSQAPAMLGELINGELCCPLHIFQMGVSFKGTLLRVVSNGHQQKLSIVWVPIPVLPQE